MGRIGVKQREEKMTVQQKEILLSFMENHLDFAKGRLQNIEGRVMFKNLWLILTNQLKSAGKQKTIQQWQRAWTDIKIKVKRKLLVMKMNRNKMSVGQIVDTKLSKFDERVIQIMLKKSANSPPESSWLELETTEFLESENQQLQIVEPSVTIIPESDIKLENETIQQYETTQTDEQLKLLHKQTNKNIRYVKGELTHIKKQLQNIVKQNETQDEQRHKTKQQYVAASVDEELKLLHEQTNTNIRDLNEELSQIKKQLQHLVKQNETENVQRNKTNVLLERIARALEK